MSDSSLSSASPSQSTLEQALRLAVQRVYKLGNLEELTVKRVRSAAEKDLDLEDGFFKSDETWKERSKNVIQSEVVRTTKVLTPSNPIEVNRNARSYTQIPNPLVSLFYRKTLPNPEHQ